MAILGAGFLAAETSIILTFSQVPENDPRYVSGFVLCMYGLLLLIMALWALRRWLDAGFTDIAPEKVHEALTPERVMALAFYLVTAAIGLNFVTPLNETVLGALASVIVFVPLVSYSTHAGELHFLLQRAKAQHDKTEQLPTVEQRLEALERHRSVPTTEFSWTRRLPFKRQLMQWITGKSQSPNR